MTNVDVRDSGMALVNMVTDEHDTTKDVMVLGVMVDRMESQDGKDVAMYLAYTPDGDRLGIVTSSDNVVWLLSDEYVYRD